MRTFIRLVAAGCVLYAAVGAGLPVSAASTPPSSPVSGDDRDCPGVLRDAGARAGFGVELLGVVSGEGRENALVSPLGIGAVLAMLAQGAKEPVRRSIREMLGVGSRHAENAGTGAAETTPAVGGPADGAASAEPMRDRGVGLVLACQLQVVGALPETDDKVDVRIANGAFADRRLDLFPAFSVALRDLFHARVERLDFADEGSVDLINSWVDVATGGAIPQLFSSLEPDDGLVLANAMRFQGKWTRPFDPERTEALPFHLRSGASVDVPTMQADDLPARYREDGDFQAVALPYGKGGFRFVVVLPRAGMAAPDALRRLAADPSWFIGRGFRPSRGSLTLPPLTLNDDVSLLPLLRELGLESALNDRQAFAGIAAPPPKLRQMLQRTMLVLDEEGTVAVAATGVTAMTTSVVMEERFHVKVDRPFAFAVVHRDAGVVLFVGWVDNPLGG